MNKKREIALITLGFLLTSMFTACSTKKVDAPQPTSTAADTKTVTLTWVVMGDTGKDAEKVNTEFNKKLQEKLPSTTVNFVRIPGAEYKQKWDLKIAAGEKMDLAWTGYAIPYSQEVQKGSYMAIDDLVNKYASEMLKEVPAYVIDKQRYKGKLYSLPNYQMVYRRATALKGPKDLLDKYANLSQIGMINRSTQYTTKEDFAPIEDYFSNLKKDGKIQLGAGVTTMEWIADKGLEGLNGETSPFVIKIFDKDLKVYNKYALDSYKTFFELTADWYKKGYIRQDILSVQNPRVDEGRANGTVTFVHGWDNMDLDSKSATQVAGFPVAVEPLDGYHYISFEASSTATAVPRTAQNPERAMQLLNLLNTKNGQDLYRLIVNGIEGEDYTKNEDGTAKVIKADDNVSYKYYLGNWVVGNVFNDYQNEDLKKTYLSNNQTSFQSPLLGFKLDTSPILSELSQIDAVVKEYNTSLVSGALTDYAQKYKEFLDKMNKAGSDKVIAEIQKQIDAFAKDNAKSVQEKQKIIEDGWKKQQADSKKILK